MKKILTIAAVLTQLFFFNPLFSAVYEASTLHNSVSRSETVQNLYMKRWSILNQENFYFDIYGKINWVFGFDVNTYNAGSGEIEATDLRLTRTYGSMTVAMPIGEFREDAGGSDFIVALTTTGFHYGLTKQLTVDRGSSGTETITDYKHSQFFDDIYAVTVMFRPYVTVHGGLIFNNEYAPEDDGTMDYFNPIESYSKTFVALEVYGCAAFSMNVDEGKPESMKTEVAINPIVGFITDVSNVYIPLAFITYERTAAYNDELFDSVWVKNWKNTLTAYDKDYAKLHILSFKLIQRVTNLFTIEGSYSAQYISEDLYTKAATLSESKKVSVTKSKEWYVLINFDPVAGTYGDVKIKGYTGMSWYWDPAIAIHRNNPGKGSSVYGWILGGQIDFKTYGADFTTEYNFSSELKKLLETSDKWAVEGSMFFRI